MSKDDPSGECRLIIESTEMSSPPNKPSGDPTRPDKVHTGFFRRLGVLSRSFWVSIVGLLAFGGASVAILDTTDYYFTSQPFCASQCHVMEIPYKELQQSTHWTTPSGVRPTCADCHVSKRLTFAMMDHFIGTAELWVQLTTDFSDPETFEALRPAAADRVRFAMLENESEACRNCHVMEGIKRERKRGQRMHETAREENTTCIACHYNLVHKEVEPTKAFLEAIEGK